MKAFLPLFFIGFHLLHANSLKEILDARMESPRVFPFAAYSEFTPSYYQGARPYEITLGETDKNQVSHYDSEHFYKSSAPNTYWLPYFEEHRYLRPGLKVLATHLMKDLQQLAFGDKPGGATLKGIPSYVVNKSPYFPEDLPKNKNQTVVSFIPLQLSRTQQELGRSHPWTIFGGADVTWEWLFWSSLKQTKSQGTEFLCNLLQGAYGLKVKSSCDLEKQQLKILSEKTDWIPKRLSALASVKLDSVKNVNFVITFEPYDKWSEALKRGFKEQKVSVIPHPSTLVFYQSPLFNTMKQNESRQLPLSIEISQFSRLLSANSYYGLKVLDIVRKPHRFQSINASDREQVSLIQSQRIVGISDNVEENNLENPFNLIFNAVPSLMGLYSKPLARNVQIWAFDKNHETANWVLDGSRASLLEIEKAKKWIQKNGEEHLIYYRNFYPPMDINGWQGYWYRPLVSWITPDQNVGVNYDLKGVMALRKEKDEAWLSVQTQETKEEDEVVQIHDKGEWKEATSLNVKKIQEYVGYSSAPISSDVAEALLTTDKDEPYSVWKKRLPTLTAKALTSLIDEEKQSSLAKTYTYQKSQSSDYEREYWKNIVDLSEGIFDKRFKSIQGKNNADCASSDKKIPSFGCDADQRLLRVADYLKTYYQEKSLGLASYFHEFQWKPEFAIDWWHGQKDVQKNLITVIPAKNGNPNHEVVILADHYDTAYERDIYEEGKNTRTGDVNPAFVGHRQASKGADDNYSATSTLMLAAKLLKDLPTKRDIWIVHLTGEEFPADCLGARALAKDFIEKNEIIRGKKNPKVVGVYVLDMVSHHRGRDAGVEDKRVVFQISPGRGKRAAHLALTAHKATQTYNSLVKSENWDEKYGRTKPFKRFVPKKGSKPENWQVPPLGKFLTFRDEIRPGWHYQSSLYNTDPQVLSDAGFPTVLFMENYDVGRTGYHDTEDDIENIDLDYGRGVSAIAIESVAQVACE